jgi:hypothetical protein
MDEIKSHQMSEVIPNEAPALVPLYQQLDDEEPVVTMQDLKNAMSVSAREKIEQQEEIVKHMTKADLKNLEESEQDAAFFASEELAFEWVEYFLSDVNRIERFFCEKQEALINEFIGMQERFRLKSTEYEDKKKVKKPKVSAVSAIVSIKNTDELLDEEI